MIKIETQLENDIFKLDYEHNKSNTLEHLMLIARLVDETLKNSQTTEKDIIKFIKNRDKYIEKEVERYE